MPKGGVDVRVNLVPVHRMQQGGRAMLLHDFMEHPGRAFHPEDQSRRENRLYG